MEVPLSELSWEVSHDLWLRLEGAEDSQASLHVIVTITTSDQAEAPGEEELRHNYVRFFGRLILTI